MIGTVRRSEPDDASRLDGLAGVREREGVTALVVEHDGRPSCAGSIDPAGSATEPGAPRLEIIGRPEDGDLAALVAALLETAAALDPAPARVTIGWDPMDAAGLRTLDELGFRPTGAMPYFELGGGLVEYVGGYRDAGGSVLDLARPLP